jgi:serine/threonine protein kinase
MSNSRDIYYPSLKRRPSGFFIGDEGFTVTQQILGKGSNGAVFDAKKIIPSSDKSNFVVKKISFDFYAVFKKDYPDKSEEEIKWMAACAFDSELVSAKREVYIFKQRYGFGELYYSPKSDIARAILLKLPGHTLSNHDFTDLPNFFSLWIKTQIETHFLHTRFNIIHGDLKFSNVIYNDETDDIFLCDFGLSRRIGEVTSGKGGADFYYLHPRLIDDPPPLADPSFDIFSLGKIIQWFFTYYEQYKHTIIKIPKANKLLKDIYLGMTDTTPKQWSLVKAIQESIQLHNDYLQPEPSKKMSLSLEEYKPSSILFSISSNVSDSEQKFIPAYALPPLDLSDQVFPPKENKKSQPAPEKAAEQECLSLLLQLNLNPKPSKDAQGPTAQPKKEMPSQKNNPFLLFAPPSQPIADGHVPAAVAEIAAPQKRTLVLK